MCKIFCVTLIEWRYADGNPEPLPARAAELVRLKVEVIVTRSGSVTRAAKQPYEHRQLGDLNGADAGTGIESAVTGWIEDFC